MSENGTDQTSVDDENCSEPVGKGACGESKTYSEMNVVRDNKQNDNIDCPDHYARGDVDVATCQVLVPYNAAFWKVFEGNPIIREEIMTSAGSPTSVADRLHGSTSDIDVKCSDTSRNLEEFVDEFRGYRATNVADTVEASTSDIDIECIDTSRSLIEDYVDEFRGNLAANVVDSVEASTSDIDFECIDTSCGVIDESRGYRDTCLPDGVEASTSDIDIECIDTSRSVIEDYVDEFRGYLAFIDMLDAVAECLDGVSTIVIREDEVVLQRRREFEEEVDDDDDDDMSPYINMCCSH